MQVRRPVLQDIPTLVRLGVSNATHVLEKEGVVIGAAACVGTDCAAFAIAPEWRQHGYGTYLMKALLRGQGENPFVLWVPQDNLPARRLCEKFGFEVDGAQWRDGRDEACYVRRVLPQLSALTVAHGFLMQYGRRGGFAIDATAGNGHDTLFLTRLAGEKGRVLALDIQQDAVDATRALLAQNEAHAEVMCDSHANLAHYASAGTVDIITFNLGYLPGGDHTVFTTPEVSVPAIRTGLGLLRRGGVLTACVYAGGEQGTRERDAVLAFFRSLPPQEYTVLITEFVGRGETQAVPVCVLRL